MTVQGEQLVYKNLHINSEDDEEFYFSDDSPKTLFERNEFDEDVEHGEDFEPFEDGENENVEIDKSDTESIDETKKTQNLGFTVNQDPYQLSDSEKDSQSFDDYLNSNLKKKGKF
jgi:hypothetical protein